MNQSKPRYFTTPLYYVNARPHLGHAFTTILADLVKRHYRQRGEQVTLLTGTDEHGEKIAQIAAREGRAPQALADEIAADFKDTWEKMNLDFDIFYRTTQPSHIRAVQAALTRLKEKGEIVFREYEGLYCVGCERFYKETELVDGVCPDHKKPPEKRKEANYFFLMSKYRERLIAHFEKNPNSIRPANFRNEVLSMLKEPLDDLCISRPKERLTWGIELPFDKNYVTYVWVDALTNYIAGTGWPPEAHGGAPVTPGGAPQTEWPGKELWSNTTHFLAKDILKTHAIYWTAMLMAWDVPIYKELQVHGYWLMSGTKMSKSLGNVLKPLDIEAVYGRETLRYYLIREMSFGLDSSFSLESYVSSVNAHLANGIGNLASRVLTLCAKNFKGTIPPNADTEVDRALQAKRVQAVQEWDEAFAEAKYQNALKAWSELVTACDVYVNDMKPWALAKAMPGTPEETRLQVVLGVCCQVLETLAILMWPILPEASCKLMASLGLGVYDSGTHAKRIPELAHATQFRINWTLGTEVPKLFARVALPVLPAE